MRNRRAIVIAAGVALMLGGNAACRRTPAPVLDADGVLRRMSDVLAAAQRLSVSARREADRDVRQGRDLPALTTISVRLVRPKRIQVELDGGENRRAMFSDGDTFTLQDITKNVYSTVPLKSTLDDLDDQLEKIYGFVPPMFEFVTNNPYDSIHARVSNLTYLGEGADATGVRCHRIAAAGEMADAELWVSTTDFLPRQLVATFTNIASHPQVRLSFSEWNLKPTFVEEELAFTAPAKAMKIPMRSVAEMQALVGKGKKK